MIWSGFSVTWFGSDLKKLKIMLNDFVYEFMLTVPQTDPAILYVCRICLDTPNKLFP